MLQATTRTALPRLLADPQAEVREDEREDCVEGLKRREEGPVGGERSSPRALRTRRRITRNLTK